MTANPLFPERKAKGGGYGVRKNLLKIMIILVLFVAFAIIQDMFFPIYAS